MHDDCIPGADDAILGSCVQHGTSNRVLIEDAEGEQWQTRTARHADRRCQPDNGGSGEAADHVALHEDESAPDEADAGDDLRGDA